jgi:hypothetical protein
MLKEIDIIEDTVRRMASNSFLLKGWTVTLVVGVLLLKGPGICQVLLGLIPVVAFWYLDAYFLRQEKLFRARYDWVVKHRLVTDEHLFDMSTDDFKNKVPSIPYLMWKREPAKDGTPKTNTLKWFYGSLAAVPILYCLVLILIRIGGH